MPPNRNCQRLPVVAQMRELSSSRETFWSRPGRTFPLQSEGQYLLRSSPLRYNAGMGVFQWLAAHWFDCVQIVGLVGGLLLTAYTIHKDARARQISNLIALNERHDDIWRTFYERAQLSRVLKP